MEWALCSSATQSEAEARPVAPRQTYTYPLSSPANHRESSYPRIVRDRPCVAVGVSSASASLPEAVRTLRDDNHVRWRVGEKTLQLGDYQSSCPAHTIPYPGDSIRMTRRRYTMRLRRLFAGLERDVDRGICDVWSMNFMLSLYRCYITKA